jgi:hypothetical protein
MLDITPALNVLKGVILEINDCTYPLLNSVKFISFLGRIWRQTGRNV